MSQAGHVDVMNVRQPLHKVIKEFPIWIVHEQQRLTNYYTKRYSVLRQGLDSRHRCCHLKLWKTSWMRRKNGINDAEEEDETLGGIHFKISSARLEAHSNLSKQTKGIKFPMQYFFLLMLEVMSYTYRSLKHHRSLRFIKFDQWTVVQLQNLSADFSEESNYRDWIRVCRFFVHEKVPQNDSCARSRELLASPNEITA